MSSPNPGKLTVVKGGNRIDSYDNATMPMTRPTPWDAPNRTDPGTAFQRATSPQLVRHGSLPIKVNPEGTLT